MKKNYMAPLMTEENVDIVTYLQDPSDGSQITIGPGTGDKPIDDEDPAKERTGLWSGSENGGKLW